jgi:hypothetical protein
MIERDIKSCAPEGKARYGDLWSRPGIGYAVSISTRSLPVVAIRQPSSAAILSISNALAAPRPAERSARSRGESATVLRFVVSFFVLVLFALPLQAQEGPDYTSAADAYLTDIQARFPASPDMLEAGASRREGQAAAERGNWSQAAGAYERAVAFGADDFATWMGLTRALRHLGRTEDAIAAAYAGRLAADRPADRAEALFTLGGTLDDANRAREAMQAYQAGLNYQYDSRVADRIQTLYNAVAFRVVGSSTQTEGERARACLRFRDELKSIQDVHYEDYVKIEPAVTPAFSVSYDTLCIDGLDFGARYTVTVLKGLRSAYEDELADTDTVAFEIGDRTPSLGFPGSAYVLPKVGSAGIPLVSVNVEQAELQLLRVTDRNLVQQIRQGRWLRALDGYDRDQILQDLGEQVWTGEIAIEPERNKRVTTLVPIAEVLPKTEPGIYVLTAETPAQADQYWDYRATQWFVISDLGLTTMSGADGLHVFVRSLATGQSIPGVDLRLYARNNEELGAAVSDADGAARFAAGLMRGSAGRTATAVMALGADGDFVFIDLMRPAFDLSDRGVGGRLAPGATDAFMYTDRGVYRPGEPVQLVTLLRDNAGHAIRNVPLTLKVHRPDGALALERTLTDGVAGGFHLTVPISESARTGTWRAYAYLDPAGQPVGSIAFLVEEVVPARIEVALQPDRDHVAPGAPLIVAVDAQYLYGAPAGDLPVKASVAISRQDRAPSGYPGFVFTLADEPVSVVQVPLDDTRTDSEGKAALPIELAEIPDTPQPLKATLTVEVYEVGGRPVIEALELPIRHRPLQLGIKPLFGSGTVPDGGEAAFEVVVVNADGTPAAAGGLRYQLIYEDWDYQWFYSNGSWDYEVVVRDQPRESGELSVAVDAPGRIAHSVAWGRYRLEVHDPASGAAASVRFSSGWWAAPGTASTPDKLQIAADKELYQAGDTARISIAPPFAGPVVVAIATDRILETRTVEATAEGAIVEVPVDAAWGAGAYVLATAYRPSPAEAAHMPSRAIGIAWLPLDPAARSLQIAMEVPAETTPRQRIDIPITVSGAGNVNEAYVTLAAVDEGILQLTDFQTPDPVGYFFGKRRLGVEVRDLYGNLIDGREGRRGAIRSGGDADAMGRRGAPPPTIQLVALFSGVVRLDAEGRARIPLDLPDFNGRLRLMAVAYDADKVGAAEAALIVRDPVVVLSSLPRFLASGDDSELSLTIQNVGGAAGAYEVGLAAAGAVMLAESPAIRHDLGVGGSAVSRVRIEAVGSGEGRIAMSVTGPNGFRLDRELRIGVRPPQLPIVERTARRLARGESLTLGSAPLERFVPGSGELYASFSPVPNLDVPGLLRSLDRYPYGCLEQTTSRALPLLYVGDVAALWQVADERGDGNLRARVQSAVDSVIERQRYDGGFGLWSSDAPAEGWLSSYAMEFLLRARQQGYTVPDFALEQGLRWLDELSRNYRRDDSEAIGARAYAYYVLASAKAGDISGLRYLHDTYLRRAPSALAAAQMGAALALLGDQRRAGEAFKAAIARVDRERRWMRDYGSALRDLAAIITLMIESRASAADPAPLMDRLANLQFGQTYLTTQEQAWLIMAAYAAASAEPGNMVLDIDGTSQAPRRDALNLKPDAAQLADGLKVTNAGNDPVWTVATVIGAPAQDLPPQSQGFTIERRYYTLAGEEVTPRSVRQTDMLVVVLSGTSNLDLYHQALLIDLLPAGFEVENARLADTRTTDDLPWLPELTPTLYTEFLDDRFVAAFDLDWGRQPYTVAYLVRAVTPGTYKLPPAEIEDMYQPQYRARTAGGTVTVTPLQ